MTILILVILSGPSVATSSTNFSSETACLKAMNSVLELEKNSTITVKARCVAYVL